MLEHVVKLGMHEYTLSAVCLVYPYSGGYLRGPFAYETTDRGKRLVLEKVGTVWIASISLGGGWDVSREGPTPQSAFDRCEWELARMFHELKDFLGEELVG